MAQFEQGLILQTLFQIFETIWNFKSQSENLLGNVGITNVFESQNILLTNSPYQALSLITSLKLRS
jgi:hypothetical protein